MPIYSAAQMTDPFEMMDNESNVPEAFEHPTLDMPHVVLYSEKPSPEQVLEMHDREAPAALEMHDQEESTPEMHEGIEPGSIEITVDDLPGVQKLDDELEKSLEVHDDTVSSNETMRAADVADSKDKDAKKSKKDPKWDWESRGAHGFVAWIKERIDDVPQHSGYDTSGIERAISYMEKLDNEISKAMRLDLDAQLDANKIEEVRAKLDDGIERLHDRLEKVRAGKGKNKRKKKADQDSGLVKEAQKATSIAGIVITVPLIISRIARVCINGTVSAGRDTEDLYKRQCEYYSLDRREKAELQQLLADMGFPIRQDRGVPMDEDFDPASEDGADWMQNFQA